MPEPDLREAKDVADLRRARATQRWVSLSLRIAISAIALALVGRQVTWERIFSRLDEIAIPQALLAFVPLIAVTFCIGLRWRVITGAVARPIRFADAWSIAMIGGALDQMCFSMSGDAYRVWWLNKSAPSLTRAVASVLLDRTAGVLGVALLVLAFLPQFAALDSSRGLVWVPMSFGAAVVFGFVAMLFIDRLPFELSRNRWLTGFGLLSSSARKVFLTPALAIPAITAAVMVHVAVSVCVAVIARSLGVTLNLSAALTVVPAVMFVSLLPISIGGWGVREGAMVVALGLVGVEGADAFLISLIFGLSTATVGLAGGVVWLIRSAPRRSGIGAL